ncbi:MAG: condensin complex protein MksE [Tannerellaceae bacterium]
MNLPKQTGDIFEELSKGRFISSNSMDQTTRMLFDIIDENYQELYDYFLHIGFKLEQGQEYFYFSRNESKTNLERKLEQAYKWIDIVDFLKTFNDSFGVGSRFSASDLEVKLQMDVTFKMKLNVLRRTVRGESHREIIENILAEMCKDRFFELENSITGTYKVLASFKYLEDLIMSINIPEEIQNEIPE